MLKFLQLSPWINNFSLQPYCLKEKQNKTTNETINLHNHSIIKSALG